MDKRTAEIITECKTIAEAIESQTLPLSRVALKARGLAQLLDDDAAFMWLTLECSGADGVTKPERPWRSGDEGMKGYKKYTALHAVPDIARMDLNRLGQMVTSGQIADKPRVLGASLAMLESGRDLAVEDQRAMAAASGGQDMLAVMKMLHHERRRVLERVAAAIHEWASNVYVVHRFRQLAGNIFERFKTQADVVLARLCPEAVAKLNNAVGKASSDNPEDWAAAAMRVAEC